MMKKPFAILMLLSVLVAILGFQYDCANTIRYGGVDLRPKVVGARLLLQGKDPYHYRWQHGDSLLLLEAADNPNLPVSRVSVPPTVLLLHMSVAHLDYKTQKIIWLLCQWTFFVLALHLLARCQPTRRHAGLVWIVGLLFISGSFFWHMHVERGQIYVLYTFLLALACRFMHAGSPTAHFLGGAILGIAAALRPPVILMLIPFCVFKKWKPAAGMIGGGALMTGASLIVSGIAVWKSYFAAMPILGRINLGLIQAPPFPNLPTVAEGVDLVAFQRFPSAASTIQSIGKYQFGVVLPEHYLSMALLCILAIVAFLLFRIRPRRLPDGVVFLTGVMLVFISEFFMPANRWSYNNILWILPLALILAHTDALTDFLKKPAALFLWTGLLFGTAFAWYEYAMLLSDGAMVLFTVWATGSIIARSRTPESGSTEFPG